MTLAKSVTNILFGSKGWEGQDHGVTGAFFTPIIARVVRSVACLSAVYYKINDIISKLSKTNAP